MDHTYQKPNPRNPKASTVLSPFCIANTRLFSLFNCAVASSFPEYLWIITTSLVADTQVAWRRDSAVLLHLWGQTESSNLVGKVKKNPLSHFVKYYETTSTVPKNS